MARPNKTSYRIQDATTQALAFTGTAATSTALGAHTTVVRLHATSACFVKIRTTSTAATTSDVPMPSGQVEYFSVAPGSFVSAIQSTASGTLYVTEVSE